MKEHNVFTDPIRAIPSGKSVEAFNQTTIGMEELISAYLIVSTASPLPSAN